MRSRHIRGRAYVGWHPFRVDMTMMTLGVVS